MGNLIGCAGGKPSTTHESGDRQWRRAALGFWDLLDSNWMKRMREVRQDIHDAVRMKFTAGLDFLSWWAVPERYRREIYWRHALPTYGIQL